MSDDNFVRVIDGALSKDECDSLIQAYGYLVSHGHTISRRKSEGASNSYKHDDAGDAADLLLTNLHDRDYVLLMRSVEKHVAAYVEEYEAGMFSTPINSDTFPISNSGVKIQKTPMRGGYHLWHSENCGAESRDRALAWIMYLNDVESGGETEFLYLSKRIAAKAGRLIIFPAGWTHTHRGNPPLVGDKVIATGWIQRTT